MKEEAKETLTIQPSDDRQATAMCIAANIAASLPAPTSEGDAKARAKLIWELYWKLLESPESKPGQ